MKKSQVYTKTGDTGTTSLVGGTRIPKSHVRLEAYGTIDELNSYIGLLDCTITDKHDKEFLSFIQHKLFTIGAYLASEPETISQYKMATIEEKDVEKLEKEMDEMDSKLPKINKFILPGGNEASARANLCRTVCRRAERRIYDVKEEYDIDENTLAFVNRLSDYFFLLGRKENVENGREIFWDQNI